MRQPGTVTNPIDQNDGNLSTTRICKHSKYCPNVKNCGDLILLQQRRQHRRAGALLLVLVMILHLDSSLQPTRLVLVDAFQSSSSHLQSAWHGKIHRGWYQHTDSFSNIPRRYPRSLFPEHNHVQQCGVAFMYSCSCDYNIEQQQHHYLIPHYATKCRRQRKSQIQRRLGYRVGTLQAIRTPDDDDDDDVYDRNSDQNIDGNNKSEVKKSAINDEKEWMAVVAALKLYKAAFGDLKVPQRFIVPNIKPWPVAAHKLRLGKVVANIRATGRYVQDHPERRAVLEDLGFVWRVREPSPATATKNVSWQQVRTALEVYRNIYPDQMEVPSTFRVPELDPWPEEVRGLPLGRYLPILRERILPKNQKAREAFAALGFISPDAREGEEPEFDERMGEEKSEKYSISRVPNEDDETISANDVRFQKVLLALETYKKIYGDLLVPQPFAVPDADSSESKDWPKETWGLRLGARVNAIRSQGTFVNTNPERRQVLDDLGFVWVPDASARGKRRGRRSKTEPEEESALTSDAADEELDSLLNGSFDFSSESAITPRDVFAGIGSGSGDGNYNEVLSTSSPGWNLEGARLAEPSNEKNSNGNNSDEYIPPQTFEDSLNEAKARALEVGIIDGLTENKRVIKGKRSKDIPWFNDDFGDDYVFEDVVEALTIYKSIFGDFGNLTRQDADYVVPIPKVLTGFMDEYDDDIFNSFDMDASTRAAAAIANFDDDDDDDDDEGPFGTGNDMVPVEFQRWRDELQRDKPAPARMTATKESGKSLQKVETSWPEHLAGMQLGNIARRIRDGSLEVKHLPERKAQLDAIGFDWGDDKYFIDIPFEKAMCAMYAYYMIRGDTFVEEDFVMPDEDPWPEALDGYDLGQAVKRLRELQNFLEAYHPEKISLLRMIDFVWFSDTMALPLDPNEAEMDSETLLLSALGHPDYSKMIDIPMGLPDKIMNDGPFMETNDDPKLWWRRWHNWEYVEDYWYEQGRRDNAYVLRKMGYPRMAAEHEAKYGPGLLSQINATLQDIEQNGIDRRTTEEKQQMLRTLNTYRQEMLGCSDIHPMDRDELLLTFDNYMLSIMKDKGVKSIEDLDEIGEYEDEEELDEDDYTKEDEDWEEEDDGDFVEEEMFDVEDELGLDNKRR